MTKAELEATLREFGAREKDAQLVADWKRAEEKGMAIPVADLIAATVTLLEKAQAVLDADATFCDALPSKAPDFEQFLRFASNLGHLIAIELYARSRGRLKAPRGTVDSPETFYNTIERAFKEHVAMGLKARPASKAAASGNNQQSQTKEARERWLTTH